METTIVYLGLYRDNGKENGNYYIKLNRAPCRHSHAHPTLLNYGSSRETLEKANPKAGFGVRSLNRIIH